jgi:Na+:H+ antiporter, NhaA family
VPTAHRLTLDDALNNSQPHLPNAPVQRWIQPFARFVQIEAASGVVLLACTIMALYLANSIHAEPFASFWNIDIALRFGDAALSRTLGHWITDGLMTIFFFVMGLEIKRSLVAGELRDPRKAALPAMAALGGMLAPAAIYLALQWGEPGQNGWGIPVATDIAFVVAVLTVFGRRISPGLKIFVLSLAIADDIGAVLVIAVFFTSEILWMPLLWASCGFGLIVFFNRIGVRRVPVYILVGIAIWLAFLESGVHPTVAGVMLGLLTPASAWVGDAAFFDIAEDAIRRLRQKRGPGATCQGQAKEPGTRDALTPDTWHLTGDPRERQRSLGEIATTAYEAVSPLERLEFALHPWVAFVIVPLFALANVGVAIDISAVTDPVVPAVAAGLFIGKPVGIMLFCLLAVKLGIARLPSGVNWPVMLGASMLAGIGFTMSLLIAGLALEGTMLEAGKIGTLIGSSLSAIVGAAVLTFALERRPLPAQPEEENDSTPGEPELPEAVHWGERRG